MYWIKVSEMVPSNKLILDSENCNDILILLSNGEKCFLGFNKINGEFLAQDYKTKVKATHWLLIENPTYGSTLRIVPNLDKSNKQLKMIVKGDFSTKGFSVEYNDKTGKVVTTTSVKIPYIDSDNNLCIYTDTQDECSIALCDIINIEIL
jgi:hypothetical protein